MTGQADPLVLLGIGQFTMLSGIFLRLGTIQAGMDSIRRRLRKVEQVTEGVEVEE
jgi:hypothetical protein